VARRAGRENRERIAVVSKDLVNTAKDDLVLVAAKVGAMLDGLRYHPGVGQQLG
jgi:hypothetical protein